MGILNYMLNQRPKNRRDQEKHDAEMREILAREAANKRLAAMGGGDLSALMGAGSAQGPALSPGVIAGAGQPPPPGPGGAQPAPAPAPMPGLESMLPTGQPMQNGPPGQPDPLAMGQAAPAQSSVNPSATQPMNSGPTSLSSFSPDSRENFALREAYARKLIASGDAILIREGMALLTELSQDQEGARQFDTSAGISQDQIGISRQNANTSAGRLDLDEDMFGYKKDVFDPRTFSQTDRQLGIQTMNARANQRRAAADADMARNGIGNVSPNQFTGESIDAWKKSKTTDNPDGNYGLLVRDWTALEQLEKRSIDLTDAIGTSQAAMAEMDSMINDANELNLWSGVPASIGNALKDVTGWQDEESIYRVRLTKLRNDSTIKNLPPGVASDKDIELAMAGFISPTRYGRDGIQSFLRGYKKLEAVKLAHALAEDQFMSQNRSRMGFNRHWHNNRDQYIRQVFEQYEIPYDPVIFGGEPAPVEARPSPAQPAPGYPMRGDPDEVRRRADAILKGQ